MESQTSTRVVATQEEEHSNIQDAKRQTRSAAKKASMNSTKMMSPD